MSINRFDVPEGAQWLPDNLALSNPTEIEYFHRWMIVANRNIYWQRILGEEREVGNMVEGISYEQIIPKSKRSAIEMIAKAAAESMFQSLYTWQAEPGSNHGKYIINAAVGFIAPYGNGQDLIQPHLALPCFRRLARIAELKALADWKSGNIAGRNDGPTERGYTDLDAWQKDSDKAAHLFGYANSNEQLAAVTSQPKHFYDYNGYDRQTGEISGNAFAAEVELCKQAGHALPDPNIPFIDMHIHREGDPVSYREWVWWERPTRFASDFEWHQWRDQIARHHGYKNAEDMGRDLDYGHDYYGSDPKRTRFGQWFAGLSGTDQERVRSGEPPPEGGYRSLCLSTTISSTKLHGQSLS